ncbi:MAG: hypothetical protein OZ928_20045 [Polyangiaceae bacterium]|nr:hypothetical protein [Polyangiaceae bacterium]
MASAFLKFALLCSSVLSLALGCAAARTGALPTATATSGRALCAPSETRASELLVVDLQPEARGDLEIAMRRGVAVVSWDCQRLVILPGCELDAPYAFAGTSPKEQVVEMASGDAVRATLPLTGARLAGELSGEFSRGGSLALALIMIGKQSASLTHATIDDLRGSCQGATHVIASATLGAFAMTTGARASARSAAEIFGAGAQLVSAESRRIETKDGSLAACRGSESDATVPPKQCDAVLRVELLPIEEPLPAVAILSEADAQGFRGKVCREPETCRSDCDAGGALSCRNWGIVLALGDGVPRDLGLSNRAFLRACELDDMSSCTMIGIALITRGPRSDMGRGLAYLERACERGVATACKAVAISAENEGNAARAARYHKRACTLGDDSSCRR